jgi:hypothetical protein
VDARAATSAVGEPVRSSTNPSMTLFGHARHGRAELRSATERGRIV